MVTENQTGSLLKVSEVAQILNVHDNTLRRWSDQGIIKTYRQSRRGYRRFKKEDINQFLAKFNALMRERQI